MKKLLIGVLTVFVIALAGLVISYTLENRYGDGLLQKPIWAELQGIESERRAMPLKIPTRLRGAIEDRNGNILGLPTAGDKFPNIWLRLDKHYAEGKIYLIPRDGRPLVSCTFVDELTNSFMADPYVDGYLREACSR